MSLLPRLDGQPTEAIGSPRP